VESIVKPIYSLVKEEDAFNLLGKSFNKMTLDLKQSIVYVADIFKSMSDSLMVATPEGTIQVDEAVSLIKSEPCANIISEFFPLNANPGLNLQ